MGKYTSIEKAIDIAIFVYPYMLSKVTHLTGYIRVYMNPKMNAFEIPLPGIKL
jgi:hypothetical protein